MEKVWRWVQTLWLRHDLVVLLMMFYVACTLAMTLFGVVVVVFFSGEARMQMGPHGEYLDDVWHRLSDLGLFFMLMMPWPVLFVFKNRYIRWIAVIVAYWHASPLYLPESALDVVFHPLNRWIMCNISESKYFCF